MTQPEISPRTLTLIRIVDQFVVKLARHWLLYANLVLAAFIGLPFLAPIMMEYGLTGPGQFLYSIYSLTCHQLAYRSWFLFGAQSSYTVEQLQHYLGVNNPPTDIFFWRDFLGNPQVGYKMAYCERDLAIYGAMLIAGLIYSLVRTRLKPLSWRVYLIFAILPMALDGFTQLFMLRESDPLLRTITGILFGALSAWLVYPYVNDAMKDTYAQSTQQLQRISQRVVS